MQAAGDLLQLFPAFGQQQSVEADPGRCRRRCGGCTRRARRWSIAGQALQRRTRIAGARIESLGFDDRPALTCRLAQRVGHDTAVFRVRRQHGEPCKPSFAGEGDLAHHFLARQKAHQEDVAAG